MNNKDDKEEVKEGEYTKIIYTLLDILYQIVLPIVLFIWFIIMITQ